MTATLPSPIARQQRLPGLTVSYRVPLMDITTAKGILRCDEDDILDFIATREIRWAFDLRSPGATKAFIRILAHSVHEFSGSLSSEGRASASGASTNSSNFGVRTSNDLTTIEAVLDHMFPHRRQYLRGTELATEWNTGSDFIHDMIKAGELKIVPGTGDTINKTPTIYRTSAEQLLRTRRMPYL